ARSVVHLAGRRGAPAARLPSSGAVAGLGGSVVVGCSRRAPGYQRSIRVALVCHGQLTATPNHPRPRPHRRAERHEPQRYGNSRPSAAFASRSSSSDQRSPSDDTPTSTCSPSTVPTTVTGTPPP